LINLYTVEGLYQLINLPSLSNTILYEMTCNALIISDVLYGNEMTCNAFVNSDVLYGNEMTCNAFIISDALYVHEMTCNAFIISDILMYMK